MAKRPPKLIALDPDDYAARHAGHTGDGRQFFLTTPFIPARGDEPGREFLALYLFDRAGELLEARIEDLGPRSAVDEERARSWIEETLASLGVSKQRRIKMAPFRVERFGVEFGLIPQPPEEPGDEWQAIMEPGNFMAFYPPWSSGEYDT